MKIKKASTFILTFIILLSAGPLQVKASETVGVIGHEYSPYQNLDQSGFQNELVREAFKAVGLMANIKIVPPLRTIHLFYKSHFAVCADGETINDEVLNKELDVRKKTYWNVPIGLMYYKPNLTLTQITALETATKFSDIDPTFTILSYGGYNPFTDAGFKGKVFIASNSPQQTLKMVRGKRNELGFEVLGVTPYFITKNDPNDLKNWGFFNTWIYAPQYMAFNGKHPKGIYYEKKFNEGLSIIKNNGVYMDIYERLYGKNNVPRSAIDDPDHEIKEEFLSKLVDDDNFDMAKFLRQVRDETGFIIEFVK